MDALARRPFAGVFLEQRALNNIPARRRLRNLFSRRTDGYHRVTLAGVRDEFEVGEFAALKPADTPAEERPLVVLCNKSPPSRSRLRRERRSQPRPSRGYGRASPRSTNACNPLLHLGCTKSRPEREFGKVCEALATMHRQI